MAHALVPPIFREVVLSDARESTNRVKNGLIKEFFSEIVVFLVKKGSYTTFNTVKKRKISKTGVKMEFFSVKNVIQKSWSAKKILRPPKLGARSPPLGMSARPNELERRWRSIDRYFCLLSKRV